MQPFYEETPTFYLGDWGLADHLIQGNKASKLWESDTKQLPAFEVKSSSHHNTLLSSWRHS